ncbi:hypothetical protein KUF83_30210 [Streptomyces sp. BV286]|uniref:hypothetical protein n=1 Tax=Streptomyces sp. BV286 TaxID=2849672 RepID=UPI001C2EA116|nr:hypothetical protein [Streptomyces sp. BV286]MBV1940811.1 hypothetical protein [Streptomyces sp. BV286]
MTTIVRTDLRPLIVAGQSAVRAVEDRASVASLFALERALLAMHPRQGSAERRFEFDEALAKAAAAVRGAKNRPEWDMVTDVERAVSRLMHEPDGATLDHPAVREVGKLAVRCGMAEGKAGAAVARAWNRAYLLGMEALHITAGATYGERSGRDLDKAVTEFLTAVRRATAYSALYDTRNALVEAALAYGLFVVGMRQPMPPGGRWEWMRHIGGVVYHFETLPPSYVEGSYPYGAIGVRRTAGDGTSGPVRYFPLSPKGKRRNPVMEALYRI